MRVHVKVWLDDDSGQVALSGWRVALLLAIHEHGSLSAAARALNVPHRTAWQRVREMEQRLGMPLVQTTSGGTGGGRSSLTHGALDFVARYQQLERGLEELIAERYRAAFDDAARRR
jgi:molybdate transport system regulatory protein